MKGKRQSAKSKIKKLTMLFVALVLILQCGVTAFAAETTTDGDPVDIGVYAKAEYDIEGVHPTELEDGKGEITTDDGIAVSVTDAPEGSVRLMVIPVPKTEKEAWDWITASLKGTANPVHTFDIYFEDHDGKRIDANGAVVTINCTHCTAVPVVCSLDSDGTVHVLTVNAAARSSAVTFTTNGSTYYVMAEELIEHDVQVEDKPGGDIKIDNPDPETGDMVTITPDPDEGKEVDDVIVRDEDGNEIPVTDNGDGTYTYEQPDGDVTVEVTFRDEKTSDSPQTGDTSNMLLWWLLLTISGTALILIVATNRKKYTARR